MKTLNNTQTKTATASANSIGLFLKGLVILSIILVSFFIGLSNQLFAAEASNQITFEKNIEADNSLCTEAFISEQSDSELALEDWMADESFFTTNLTIEIEEAQDEQLEIADWMLDKSYFESKDDSKVALL